MSLSSVAGMGHGRVALPGTVVDSVADSVAQSMAGVRATRHQLARVRWSRVFSLLLVAALVVGAGVAFLGRAQADAPVDRGDGAVVVGSQASLSEHVVAPGDTLWALAQQVAPGADPRETVDRIMRLNGLQGVDVQVGTVLLLPR